MFVFALVNICSGVILCVFAFTEITFELNVVEVCFVLIVWLGHVVRAVMSEDVGYKGGFVVCGV